MALLFMGAAVSFYLGVNNIRGDGGGPTKDDVVDSSSLQ